MADYSAPEQVTRKKGYVPDDDKDYELCEIEIEHAENGVVVCCRYKLTEDAQKKMKASKGEGFYCDSYGSDRERHVFEDKVEAKKFIAAELDALWP